MTTQKLEKQITQGEARLAEIISEMSKHERAKEHGQHQLAQARSEVDDLTASIKTSRSTSAEHGAELAEALREVARLEDKAVELERNAEPKLRALEKEQEHLQTELAKAARELNRARFSDAVIRYQEALRPAMPIADEIRALARRAGIALAPDDVPSCLLHRDPEFLNIAGYVLKV